MEQILNKFQKILTIGSISDVYKLKNKLAILTFDNTKRKLVYIEDITRTELNEDYEYYEITAIDFSNSIDINNCKRIKLFYDGEDLTSDDKEFIGLCGLESTNDYSDTITLSLKYEKIFNHCMNTKNRLSRDKIKPNNPYYLVTVVGKLSNPTSISINEVYVDLKVNSNINSSRIHMINIKNISSRIPEINRYEKESISLTGDRKINSDKYLTRFLCKIPSYNKYKD
jgi:hypothetical protein